MGDKLQAEGPVNSSSAFQVMCTTLGHHTLGIASKGALPNWWTESVLGQHPWLPLGLKIQRPLGIERNICQYRNLDFCMFEVLDYRK